MLINTILLNIYLSQLVRVRGKYTFLSFSDFQTLNPWFPLKHAPVSTPSFLNMPLCPPLLLMVWDTGSKIQGHRTEQSTHCALDWHINTGHKSWVWRYFLWVMEGGRRGRRLSPPAPSACLRSAAQPPPPPGDHLRLEELPQQQQHPWQDAPVGRFLHLRRHWCLLRRRWAFSVFNLSKSLWKDKLWPITHIQLPCFQAILRRLLEEAGGEGPWPKRCDGQPLGIGGLFV